MSAMQKFAWFNLAVVGLTLVVVLSLFPFGGRGAFGGFGILGVLGFGMLFFRKTSQHVVADERDQLIWQRAWFLAYAVFWVVFVFATVFLSAWFYGWEGTVPVWVVQSSVWFGFMLLFVLASIAILVQYGGGPKDAE